MKKAMQWLKGEPVLAISAVLALVSCLVVLPDKEYLGYVDGRVLALLYCLMAVVAGMEQAGAFRRMAAALVKRSGSGKGLCLVLVMLCFFSSMLVTNDVALITFVPFAVLVLAASGQGGPLPWVVSLQTVAANLGSMLTPVGNPQNLYLYSRYGFSAGEFFALTVPATLASLVVLVVLCLLTPARRVTLTAQNEEGPMTPRQRAQLILCGVLFCVCLASVFHLLPWPALLAAVIVALAVFDRKLVLGADFALLVTFVCFFVFAGNLARIPALQNFLASVMQGREMLVGAAARLGADFALLVTFVCFFVFAGNLARIPALQNFLASVMQGREMLVGAAASQVISNVPAAVLLSGFTENGAGLLMGVDLGGLGTPIASLASLISLKIYSKAPGANTGRYLAVFSALNFGLLAVLLALAGCGIL